MESRREARWAGEALSRESEMKCVQITQSVSKVEVRQSKCCCVDEFSFSFTEGRKTWVSHGHIFKPPAGPVSAREIIIR